MLNNCEKADERLKIEKKILLLCEGKDACYFLIKLIHDKMSRDDFQVFNFGGISNLSNFLLALKNTDGYESVKYIIIFRDAEGNYLGAKKSIISAAKKIGFKKMTDPLSFSENDIDDNKKIAYVLFPSCSKTLENGTLEDLCLEIINDNKASKIIPLINEFHKKLITNELTEKKGGFKCKHKTILHSYFSVKDKLVGLKLGEVANINAFDFNNQKIKNIIDLCLECD